MGNIKHKLQKTQNSAAFWCLLCWTYMLKYWSIGLDAIWLVQLLSFLSVSLFIFSLYYLVQAFKNKKLWEHL